MAWQLVKNASGTALTDPSRASPPAVRGSARRHRAEIAAVKPLIGDQRDCDEVLHGSISEGMDRLEQWFSMSVMANHRKAARDLFLFLAAFFVVWTLRATRFYAVDESIASPTLRAAYSDLLKFILWVLPATAFARWLRRTPPVKYLGFRSSEPA